MKTSFLENVKQVMFLLLVALCSFVGIAQTTQPHVIINPIGGNKTPDTTAAKDIGGSRPPVGELKCDIGGRGDVGTGAIAFCSETSEQSEIGGRQEVPTSPITLEIGGRGSDTGVGQKSRNFEYFSTLDIGGKSTDGGLLSSSFASTNDIGGRGTGTDTGGQKDIGGRSTGGEFSVAIGGRSQDPTVLVDITDLHISPVSGVYS